MAGNTNSGRKGKDTKLVDKPAKQSTFTERPPTKLHPQGKKYWKKIVPILTGKGVLENMDFFALDRLCQLVGMWVECRQKVKDNGMTYETQTDRGSFVIRERPEVKIMKGLEKELQTLERKFGLTPADRETIKAHGSVKGRVKGGNSMRDRYS